MADSKGPKHDKGTPPNRTETTSSNWFGDGKHVDPKTPKITRDGNR